MTLTWKERVVTDRNGYPAVYWPSHPLAYADGMVYVHRAVWYEKHGVLPDKHHVHHIDEDKYNWSIENLECLSPTEHSRYHNLKNSAEPRTFICSVCRAKVVVNSARLNRVTCSKQCSAKRRRRIAWPAVEDVKTLVETLGYVQTGKILGVSNNAVKKFIQGR